MAVKRIRFFLIFLLATAPASFAFAFDVYVETAYKNQPDLSRYGVKDLRMIYAQSFWSTGHDRQLLPSKKRVIDIAARDKDYTGLLVLDIEHWPVNGSDAKVATTVNKLITVLDWVKSAAPKAKVGYYWVIPVVGGYWASQKPTSSKVYISWHKKNDKLQALADKVDAFFPTFYPVAAKQSAWVNYAVAGINECKRLGKGKPIYPFTNPRFHPTAYGGLAWKLVPQDYVALQLKTIKQSGAAGVVIWGADNRKKLWSDTLPWWQATKEFLGLK